MPGEGEGGGAGEGGGEGGGEGEGAGEGEVRVVSAVLGAACRSSRSSR